MNLDKLVISTETDIEKEELNKLTAVVNFSNIIITLVKQIHKS